MSTRNELIRLLERNRGRSLSGEELAGLLGVSRNAIWKAVNSLRADGYRIDAAQNRGYMLSGDSDILSAEGIYAFLGDLAGGYSIIIKKELDSTNSELRRLADMGAESGTVVAAELQTNGRGRLGRSFYSPKSNGIYMSLLLRRDFSLENASLITTAVSVAVCRAIERTTGRHPSIKWVNDLFLNGKKICGILTEAINNFESGKIEYVIIGIGLNCKKADMPEDLRDIAGSLEIEDGVTRNELAAEILRELIRLDELIEKRSYLAEYRERSMVIGKRIKILGQTEEYAIAVDIDESGGLVAETDNGERKTLLSGEISIRLSD